MHKDVFVIFDVDGVLIDSVATNWLAINQALAPYNVHIDDIEIGQYLGKSLKDQVEQLNNNLNLSLDYVEFEPILSQIKSTLSVQVQPERAARELLSRLHAAKIPMAVATSNSRFLTETRLKDMGLAKYFKLSVTGDNVTAHKPDPEIYLKAAGLLGASPSACIVFEDAPAGVNAAKAAGMQCVAIATPYVPSTSLEKADLIISSLDEITLNAIHSLINLV